MNKSGIIYPDPQKTDAISDSGFTDDAEKMLVDGIKTQAMMTDSYPVSNDPENFVSYGIEGGFSETGFEALVTESSETLIGEESEYLPESNNYITNNEEVNDLTQTQLIEHKEFIVNNYSDNNYSDNDREKKRTNQLLEKMQKSPHKTGSGDQRRFTSEKSRSSDGVSGFKTGSTQRDYSDDRRPVLGHDNKSSENNINDGLSLRNNQTRRISDKSSDLKKTTGSLRGKTKTLSYPRSRDNKPSESKSKVRQDVSEKKDKDGVLLNMMFIFEIFRWFTGGDVVVRLIVAAIAGIVGFGIIFANVGVMGYF